MTIVFFVLAVGAHFLLKHTRFGTNVYATGANLNAARLSGVNTNKTIIGVYALVATCAALSAVFISSRMMTAMPELGIGQEMDVIASVVIGGTAFSGGVGDIPGTVLGVLFLALIKNGILKLGISPFVQPIVIGGLIIVAVIVDTWYRRLAERMISQAALRRRAAANAAGEGVGGRRWLIQTTQVNPILLRCRNVTKSYSGVVVLRDVDFSVKRGEIHALVGENGAGKSTLIKVVTGVTPRDSGDIVFDGHELPIEHTKSAALALGIGVIYQELSLIPGLTIAQNIYLTREPLLPGSAWSTTRR